MFEQGVFRLVPIRFTDRYDIMHWRNEQMYHLRQQLPLTQAIQDQYFGEVIQELFDQDTPDQILFSFLENDQCIGYGGLVHINWTDRHAELSFIMDTSLEAERFDEIWSAYLPLIEEVAFKQLVLHKIFTYAFDMRPHLYEVLEKNSFFLDATLRDHCLYEGEYVDVIIHAKLNDLR